jgi:hypothetical protein
MDPATNGPPFYATVTFGILATVAVIAVILLPNTVFPDVDGRPVRGMQQFGIVLLAAYWLIIFPKSRKSRAVKKAEPGSDAKL